jgi:uncharacterized cupin superfamily protein
MPKIDIAKIPARTKTVYPAEFRDVVKGREKQALGKAAGLTQFGVNLTRLKPGAASALRHWHEAEDELIYMLEGELVLIENEGETVLRPGDAAGFKAGVANGHQLVNRSARDAIYLEVGTCAARDHVEYPDVDLVYDKDGTNLRLTHKNGQPYPRTET